MNKALLEQQLASFPLYQYMFIDTRELVFSDRVRHVCETECPMYGKSWACPPAVGSVAACRARCLSYPDALVITTITEVSDIANLQETLDTRADHEAITHQVAELLRQQCSAVYVLSTEACAVCETCAYPDGPCRHPERMFPCVESHGIIATDLAEKYGIDFIGGNVVTWFSILLYRD